MESALDRAATFALTATANGATNSEAAKSVVTDDIFYRVLPLVSSMGV